MRPLGKLLAGLGLTVGILLGVALMFPGHLGGINWLIAVGLAKLTFIGSLGLIGAGAVLQRLANREDRNRRQLEEPGARAADSQHGGTGR
jgi:hypothetical protein